MKPRLNQAIAKQVFQELIKNLKGTGKFNRRDNSGIHILLIPDALNTEEQVLISVGDFSTHERRNATIANAREKALRVIEQNIDIECGPMSSFSGRCLEEKKYGGGLYFDSKRLKEVNNSFSVACSGLPEIWDEIFVLVLAELIFPGNYINYYIGNIDSDPNHPIRFILEQAQIAVASFGG